MWGANTLRRNLVLDLNKIILHTARVVGFVFSENAVKENFR